MKKLFTWFSIALALWSAFHLGTVWATYEIYGAIDAIHETPVVYNAGTPHKVKDFWIMDKFQ